MRVQRNGSNRIALYGGMVVHDRASYSALQSKCSEVDHRCEQLQIQVNGSRTEMQYILLQLEKVEQRMETIDMQLHAFIEDTDMVVLSSK